MAFLIKFTEYKYNGSVESEVSEITTDTLNDAIEAVNSNEKHIQADIYENGVFVLFMRSGLGSGRQWFTV